MSESILWRPILWLGLANFVSLISFYVPFGSLMFSGGIERDQWHEIG